MSVYSPVEYLADQLQTASPDRDWTATGVDRAKELAQMLYTRKGVRDLSKLRLVRVKVTDAPFPWSTPVDTYHFSMSYDGGPYWGYIGTNDRVENDSILENVNEDYLLAWSSAGHGNVRYRIEPAPSGRGFVIVPVWGSSSDAGVIRSALITIASVWLAGFAMGGVSAGAALGTQIVGAEIAAAYPTFTTAIGNIAISTAMNGGDVEAAIKGGVLSLAGGQAGALVGNLASSATGLEAIGRVASSATSAFIRGGDVTSAVTGALLQYGASTLSDVLTPTPAPVPIVFPEMPDMEFTPIEAAPPDYSMGVELPVNFQPVLFDPFNGESGMITTFSSYGDTSNSGDPYNPDPTYTSPFVFDLSSGGAGGDPYNPFPVYSGSSLLNPEPVPAALETPIAPGGSGYQATPLPGFVSNTIIGGNLFPTSPISSPIPQSGANTNTDFSLSNVTQSVSQLALAALQVFGAYRNLTSGGVNTSARVVNSNGAVSVVQPNGTIQTRNPNGTITTSVLPPKQPQTDMNGNIVVNNGNGTYTTVSPQGTMQTLPYASGTAGSGFSLSTITQNPALLYGGLAALAFLLIRK